MTLTLRAVTLNEMPLSQPIKAHFDGSGGTIGRADHNTMALPDPERIISREQALIKAVGAGYVIKNIGSANPIGVRNRLLERGESSPIAGGDQVRMGGYLLEVVEDQRLPDGDATMIAGRRAAVVAQTGARADAVVKPLDGTAVGIGAGIGVGLGVGTGVGIGAGPGGVIAGDGLNGFSPLSADNPFSGLLNEAAPKAPRAGGSAPSTVPSREPWSERLPTHFDPFAPQTAEPRAAASVPDLGSAHTPVDSIADILPGAQGPSVDDLLGPRPGEQGDPIERFLAEAPAARSPAAADEPAVADFRETLRSLDAAAPSLRAVEAQRTTLPDQLSELKSAYRPPRLASAPASLELNAPLVPPLAAAPLIPAPTLAAVPPLPQMPTRTREAPASMPAPISAPASPALAAAQIPPVQPAEIAELWAAFCAGAGIELEPPQGLTPELMGTIGNLLRAAVDGTLRLTSFRAATRSEMGAEVTLIKARENNPLKFSPDAQSALEQMLRPTRRAYLPPVEAMNAVMDDLLGHAIGTMAGTKAALTGVLARFGPDELEAKLADRTVLDAMWRLNRKARLWDLYLQHHQSIRDEAQDDFNTLFGKAFLAAYEQQVEALKRERNSPPSA